MSGNGLSEKWGEIVTDKMGAFVAVATVAVEYAKEGVGGSRGEVGGDCVGVLVGFVGLCVVLCRIFIFVSIKFENQIFKRGRYFTKKHCHFKP